MSQNGICKTKQQKRCFLNIIAKHVNFAALWRREILKMKSVRMANPRGASWIRPGPRGRGWVWEVKQNWEVSLREQLGWNEKVFTSPPKSSPERAVKVEWGGIPKSSLAHRLWLLNWTLHFFFMLLPLHGPCKYEDVVMWLQLVSVSEPMPRRYPSAMHHVRRHTTCPQLHDAPIYWLWNRTLGLNGIWASYAPRRTVVPPPWLPLPLLELASRELRAQIPPTRARKQSFPFLFILNLYHLSLWLMKIPTLMLTPKTKL